MTQTRRLNLRRLQLLDYGDVLLEYLIDDSRSALDPISFPALGELEIHDIRFTKEFKSLVPGCFFGDERR